MFRWLQGPGAAFKDPLPGSTNYLNAYDADGRLYRVLENARPRRAETPPAVPGEDELGNVREKNIAGGNELPRETQQDLMPFPLNRNFSSQAVLSEELREEIWARVVLGQKSVMVVSAELGVEMNRIGAVVRLKTVEKEWIRTVRRSLFLSLRNWMRRLHDEIQVKIRLVLKTTPMVTHIHALRASLTTFHLFLPGSVSPIITHPATGR